jgi:hypothetical protein
VYFIPVGSSVFVNMGSVCSFRGDEKFNVSVLSALWRLSAGDQERQAIAGSSTDFFQEVFANPIADSRIGQCGLQILRPHGEVGIAWKDHMSFHPVRRNPDGDG